MVKNMNDDSPQYFTSPLKPQYFYTFIHCAQNKCWTVKKMLIPIHATGSSSQKLVNKLSSVWVSIIMGTQRTRGRPVGGKWWAMLGCGVTPILCHSVTEALPWEGPTLVGTDDYAFLSTYTIHNLPFVLLNWWWPDYDLV